MVLGTLRNNKGSLLAPNTTKARDNLRKPTLFQVVVSIGGCYPSETLYTRSIKVSSYLVISALGHDKPGIIEQLTRLVVAHQCNIHDSRMTVLGGEFAILLMASGADASLRQLERDLPTVAAPLGLTTIARRTEARSPSADARPYRVDVVALDHPGIVHEIAGFFSQNSINIEEMDTGTYAAAHTGSPMFSLSMVVNVPSSKGFRELRDGFLDFCDERNLDATIEPQK